ncbi:MAG: class I SAM-dependent methyltransferase [Deltaproteobacteria bacterium]|nr:class I SAM-dependent methyltransferase [Deltaproteobacteria bacterium]
MNIRQTVKRELWKLRWFRVGKTNDQQRQGFVEEALKALPARARILDAGAGELRFKKFCSHLEYLSQDFGGYDGKGDSKGLHMGSWDQSKIDFRCDITAIPQDDGSFDAILCTEVLEHVPDPLAALKEFSRLLKPGGTLILTAPFCSLTHFAPFHYSTGFSRYFYEKHLHALGFAIERLEENGNYFEYTAQELRRLPEMAKRYAGGSALGPAEAAAVQLLLKALARFSRDDQGSKEVLCFGLGVVARKEAS